MFLFGWSKHLGVTKAMDISSIKPNALAFASEQPDGVDLQI